MRSRKYLKKTKLKRKNSISRSRNTGVSESQNTPIDQIMFLQRKIGNKAVQRMLQGSGTNSQQSGVRSQGIVKRIQAKLKIGQTGDKYEQEADNVADTVMSMPENTVVRSQGSEVRREEIPVQRMCAECEEEEESIQAKSISSDQPKLQRQEGPEVEEEEPNNQPVVEEEEEEEEEQVQAKEGFTHSNKAATNLETSIDSMRGGGKPLPKSTRAFFETRFGHDFSGVSVHTDEKATETAQAVNARAFTTGEDIVFGKGQYAPEKTEGKRLLGHELTHVLQQEYDRQEKGQGVIYRKTKGEETAAKTKNWLELDAKLKKEVDVLKVAIREAKKGKSVAFNRGAGLKRLSKAAMLLGIKVKELKDLKFDWNWLVDNRRLKAKESYKKKEAAFFAALKSPLKKLKKKFPKQQTHYWLKNSPAQVLEIIHKVSDAVLPADELWAYAFKEGLVDYVRDEIGLDATSDPTEAQLKAVKVTNEISGFDYLGLDDFMTELSAKRKPLTGFLPAGFDLKKVKEIKEINEKGREVKSGKFPAMLMAVQALLAMLKRRRKLFTEDAKANGYNTPSREELVYWTYLYFNIGEFGGKKQLEKYKGKRKLSDWINKGEYSNSIKLLQSYRMVKAMKIF